MIRFLVGLVDACGRHRWFVVVAALSLTLLAAYYAAGHLRLVADTNSLFSPELAWQKTQNDFDRAFPLTTTETVIVIEGASAEAVDGGTAALAAALRRRPDVIASVQLPDTGPFFDAHGALYLSTAELGALSDRIVQAQPLIGPLEADPSLRGLFGVLTQAIERLADDPGIGDGLAAPLTAIAATTSSVAAGQPRALDWSALMTGGPTPRHAFRHFIQAQAVLDLGAFQPGGRASALIRATADALHFADRGLTLRLTGEIPLSDEEFAGVTQGAAGETALSILLVVVLLWLGLRAFRLIFAIVVTLAAGLVLTAAFAAAAVGSLNVISVAFAVLFIGISVDFGIQFTMRYRATLHDLSGQSANAQSANAQATSAQALALTARAIVQPLAIAGLATALGFFAFLPTDYRGVSDLGLIAGAGMVIALLGNLTLLPALLAILPARGRPEAAGFGWAAPVDVYLAGRAKPILILALIAAVATAAVLPQTRFDGDPLDLKDPSRESVLVTRELTHDPAATPYRIEIMAPDLAAATALRDRLMRLPEIADVLTLASYVPEDQAAKLDILDQTRLLLGPAPIPKARMAAPTPGQEQLAVRDFAVRLKAALASKIGGVLGMPGHDMAAALDGFLAMPGGGDVAMLHQELLGGFTAGITALRQAIAAEPVSIDTLPPDIRANWIAADGRARLSVFPKGDMRDIGQLRRFVDAVRAVAPVAAGVPVNIFEASATVSDAFFRASALALAAITLCLGVVLRSVRDVSVVMIPLLLAGLLTLATAVLIGLEFNFLNIIAIPLLMSIGVAFDIYFVMAWRASQGPVALLQTATARAVLFSALTTATAFGSLALSPHAGSASLGRLLLIALGYLLVCTLLVQPALMTVWGRGRRPVSAARASRAPPLNPSVRP